jgi:CxxC-x17-CxxC domain-containing protein
MAQACFSFARHLRFRKGHARILVVASYPRLGETRGRRATWSGAVLPIALALTDGCQSIGGSQVERSQREEMPDKTLVCKDCGRSFVFTANEQEFFAQKGFTDPSRCPDCRAARKASRDGGGSFTSSRSSSSASGDRQMFPAVCAQCGKETMVPFQPRGDRPVYCADCYAQQRGTSSYGSRSSGGRSDDRRSSGGGRSNRW